MKRRSQKQPQPKKKRAESNPGMIVPSFPGEAKRPDVPEDKMLLQEAILWVTRNFLDEHRAEIIKRAEERVKQLLELRG